MNPNAHLNFIADTLKSLHDNTPPNKAAFLADPNAMDATLMRLQDIGEQLIHIRDKFPEFYEQNHTDEWHKLIGLRNIIAHGYREVDFEIIWEIVSRQLEDFTSQMNTITNQS